MASRFEHTLDSAQTDDQINRVVEMLKAVMLIRKFLLFQLLDAPGMKRAKVNIEQIGMGRAETQSQSKKSRL